MSFTFTTFTITFTTFVQFAILKVCTFFYFCKKKNIFEKNGNLFFSCNKTDTSLYFLTVEKVAVSLPTKCRRNPTSGSALIGDHRFGHAHFLQRGNINPRP